MSSGLASRLPTKIKDFLGCAFGFILLIHFGVGFACHHKVCQFRPAITLISTKLMSILAKFCTINGIIRSWTRKSKRENLRFGKKLRPPRRKCLHNFNH